MTYFQERLYCIQWMRRKPGKKQFEYDFRGVTEADLERERIVERRVAEVLGRMAGQWLGTRHADRSRRTAAVPRSGPCPVARLDPLAPYLQPPAVTPGGPDQPFQQCAPEVRVDPNAELQLPHQRLEQ